MEKQCPLWGVPPTVNLDQTIEVVVGWGKILTHTFLWVVYINRARLMPYAILTIH